MTKRENKKNAKNKQNLVNAVKTAVLSMAELKRK
jgi:hypothetical protein